MKQTVESIPYKRLRAPRDDGGVLFDPPRGTEAFCLRQNLSLSAHAQRDVAGQSLESLRQSARQSLLRNARQYTSQYLDVPDSDLSPDAPVILSGHQPHLVHAGVWFKNFVLAELARRTGSHAIHLLIDNDAVQSTFLRVPSGSPAAPMALAIPFDRPSPPVPFEQRKVLDFAQFATFGTRVVETLRSLVPHPLIEQWWPWVVEAAQAHGNLGRAFSEARHRLEFSWGLGNWELPLSAVCDDGAFQAFAAELLVHAEQFRAMHNDSLLEFRRVNKVRSHTHPVPDLARYDEWIEVPFWLWSRDDPQRRPAFVHQSGTALTLTDRHAIRIPMGALRSEDAAVCAARIADAQQAGIRLRPRALITTMFARLVLSDLFIHGIGGAKYDQLTDALIRRFFGLEPPEYLVTTATFKLPVPRTNVALSDITRVEQQMRELVYHPELWARATPDTMPLIAEKQAWIHASPHAIAARVRHEQIERLNRQLAGTLEERRQQLERERMELRALLRHQAVLNAREYAFCLFPADCLRQRLLDLSRQGT